MTQPAAFRACYADWKLVKTRSTVQIVLEVPVEQAGLAYEVLGGMPQPGSEVWCGVARLNLKQEEAAEPRPQSPDKAPSGGAPRAASKSFHEMVPAQQAGILCNEDAFVRFLIEKYKDKFNSTTGPANHYDRAAQVVRSLCQVQSRSEIGKDNFAITVWRELVSDYRAWMREPAVVA